MTSYDELIGALREAAQPGRAAGASRKWDSFAARADAMLAGGYSID